VQLRVWLFGDTAWCGSAGARASRAAMRTRRATLGAAAPLAALLLPCAAAAAAAAWCEGAARAGGPRKVGHLALRGGGNALGPNGEAITEEQAGEELIKAATANNIAVSPPPPTLRAGVAACSSASQRRSVRGAAHSAASHKQPQRAGVDIVLQRCASPALVPGTHCILLGTLCRGWIQQGSTFSSSRARRSTTKTCGNGRRCTMRRARGRLRPASAWWSSARTSPRKISSAARRCISLREKGTRISWCYSQI